VGKFGAFGERPKAKSVSASSLPVPLTSGPVPRPCPQTPIIGASHLYLGALLELPLNKIYFVNQGNIRSPCKTCRKFFIYCMGSLLRILQAELN